MTPDPFTQVFNKLWQVLANDTDFAALVVPGNQPTGDAAGATRERIHRASALPRDRSLVAIFPVPGGQFPERETSGSYICTQRFGVSMATDSIGFTDKWFPLKYATLRALERARKFDEKLGLPFVTGFKTVDASESNAPTDVNNETPRWAGVIAINVTMCLSRGELS